MDYLLSNSECSSGCESGWTLYLDNSFVSNGFVEGANCNFIHEEKRVKKVTEEEEEEEEDLSMVSDASSGPPHFVEEDEFSCYYNASLNAALPKKSEKIKKNKEIRPRKVVHEKQSSLLDDTASSPVFDISNSNFTIANNHDESDEKVLDFSQGYSTTHFQGRSAYQGQYGFFHSSLSGNYLQENQWFPGRR